jgi:hypothetical protein
MALNPSLNCTHTKMGTPHAEEGGERCMYETRTRHPGTLLLLPFPLPSQDSVSFP